MPTKGIIPLAISGLLLFIVWLEIMISNSVGSQDIEARVLQHVDLGNNEPAYERHIERSLRWLVNSVPEVSEFLPEDEQAEYWIHVISEEHLDPNNPIDSIIRENSTFRSVGDNGILINRLFLELLHESAVNNQHQVQQLLSGMKNGWSDIYNPSAIVHEARWRRMTQLRELLEGDLFYKNDQIPMVDSEASSSNWNTWPLFGVTLLPFILHERHHLRSFNVSGPHLSKAELISEEAAADNYAVSRIREIFDGELGYDTIIALHTAGYIMIDLASIYVLDGFRGVESSEDLHSHIIFEKDYTCEAFADSRYGYYDLERIYDHVPTLLPFVRSEDLRRIEKGHQEASGDVHQHVASRAFEILDVGKNRVIESLLYATPYRSPAFLSLIAPPDEEFEARVQEAFVAEIGRIRALRSIVSSKVKFSFDEFLELVSSIADAGVTLEVGRGVICPFEDCAIASDQFGNTLDFGGSRNVLEYTRYISAKVDSEAPYVPAQALLGATAFQVAVDMEADRGFFIELMDQTFERRACGLTSYRETLGNGEISYSILGRSLNYSQDNFR